MAASTGRRRSGVRRRASLLATGGAFLAAPLLAAPLLAAPLLVAPSDAAGSSCSLAPTGGAVTRTIGLRSYRLLVPPGLAGPSAPLLVSLHGAGGTSGTQESATGWSPFAEREGLLVAYPQGILNLWNTGEGSPDVAFVRQVVDDVAATWCVDAQRVYADGHSNGAYLSQRLACDAGDRFAAVVEYAGGAVTPCAPARPVGVGLFHGEADTTVPPSAGLAARDGWIERDRCSATPVVASTDEGTLERYTGCAGGVEVWWRTYADQGHLWPDGTRGEDQRRRMWEFLSAHRLASPAT